MLTENLQMNSRYSLEYRPVLKKENMVKTAVVMKLKEFFAFVSHRGN